MFLQNLWSKRSSLRTRRPWVLTAIMVTILGLLTQLAGCTARDQAQQQANTNAANAPFYLPKNGIERRNYNWRQELADDPALILWCTSAFTTPGSPIFTVPILTKLTSGGKRPYPQYDINGHEDAGPDSMYGSSGEYRYGFGPSGKSEYYDFYGIETFCTTQPTVWQKESTVLVFEKDPALNDATNLAEQALAAGNPELARQILQDAINLANEGK
jgi:hypothetical protein